MRDDQRRIGGRAARVFLLLSLSSRLGAQQPAPSAASPACVSAADAPSHYGAIVRQLLEGMRRERGIHMSVTTMWEPTLVGPAYSGGQTPALSDAPIGVLWIGPDLLNPCIPDDEAAWVLAHELAHIYLGHSGIRANDWMTWRGQRMASMGDRSARSTREAHASERAAVAGHEAIAGPVPGSDFGYGWWAVDHARLLQRQEDQADELAVAISGQGGFQPRSAVDYLTRIGHLYPGYNIRDPYGSHTAAEDRAYNVAYWADTQFPALSGLIAPVRRAP